MSSPDAARIALLLPFFSGNISHDLFEPSALLLFIDSCKDSCKNRWKMSD